MLIPLPSIIGAALSASQPWPVTVTRPPLYYEPLEQMAVFRQQQQEESLRLDNNNHHVLPVSPLDLFSSDSGLFVSAEQTDNPFFRVALGLLYLSRLGFADECHALVLPLSWADDTPMGYGPPNPSTPAEAAATYAHSLLHRWEGSTVGEFNMVGYANSNFWAKATLARAQTSSSSSSLPLDHVRRSIETLLKISSSNSNGQCANDDGEPCISAVYGDELSQKALEAGRKWFHEWIEQDFPHGGWEPRALTELCKMMEKKHKQPATPLLQGTNNIFAQQQVVAARDPLAEFGGRAAQIECDVLIYYCLQQAGYDIPLAKTCRATENAVAVQQNSEPKDETVAPPNDDAIRAASKVSSAHLSSFQQNGVIVIRNVLHGYQKNQHDHLAQPAIAVACRLLDAPVCKAVPINLVHDSLNSSSVTALVYYIYNSSSDKRRQTVMGFEIGEGDVLVASSSKHGAAATDLFSWNGAVVPCQANDNAAIYRDALYGTRGETPTTVIQWSEGTIF